MPSIQERIRDDLIQGEKDLWTAFTSANPGPAVEKLCIEEANMLFPQLPVLTLKGNPTLSEAIKPPFHHFDNYQFDDLRFIYINLSAGVLTYELNATIQGKRYNSTCSTTWSQGSDGEWRIACHSESQ